MSLGVRSDVESGWYTTYGELPIFVFWIGFMWCIRNIIIINISLDVFMYSYPRVMTRMQGPKHTSIAAKQTCIYVCVPNSDFWIISKILFNNRGPIGATKSNANSKLAHNLVLLTIFFGQ